MAKKNSTGSGIIIIGLIVFAMAAKYWYLFVAVGIVAFLVWGIAKLAKSWATSEIPEKDLDIRAATASNSVIDTPKQHARCAYCNAEGLHSVLRSSDKTIDFHCFACGKNFFIYKFDSNKVTTNYQPSAPNNSTSQPIPSDATIFEASAQQPKSSSPDALWVPCGRTIQHAGYTIPGGLIYFGSGLKSVTRWNEEPALIDTSLPVISDNPDREGRNMGYWPSYTQIHPASRAAYLDWLSTGRKDPKTNIGYVFIYFYGLERRALADARDSASARNDVPAIITEVKRLLSIYGENGSFHAYAGKFLDALRVTQTTVPLYRTSPQIDSCSWEVPLTLKIALGQMARDDIPVSSEWALAWAENDPSMPRRMPVQRCPDEFRELFRIRYSEKFGDGFKLKPNKTRIQAAYRPASSSFGGQVDIPMPDLPDITRLTGPSSKINDLVNSCTDELEGYSRYLGRNPDGRNSIEATSYLPQPLLKKHAGKDFQRLINWLNGQVTSDAPVSAPFSSIVQQIPSINRDGFGKKEATAIANLLGKMSIGIEPDPRFGCFVPKPEQDVVLFRIGDSAPNSPSAEYSAATVVLHLASAVAGADGSVDSSEERHLEEHLEAWLHLTSDEKTRLRAHNQWLLSSYPGMSGVKKRIELLNNDQRVSLGRFLVGVAQADGYIDPTEMKMLTKIYAMLGLDTQSLYSHAHAAAVEPVTIQAADLVRPQGYAIPSPPAKPTEGISLDMSSIEAKLAETVAVSAILNNIFTEEEPASSSVPVSEPANSDVSIAGLDPESSAFMRMLASKLIWARDELEKLAADHNLMLDGTLDSINDAAFDHFGGPFFDGDDPIEIDPEIVGRLGSAGLDEI
ncbi:MAG: TerB N-terminal domain-containing protein [Deltaproteobacteria bacterium]|nr:TerB N-terminal domain-containing protein [Deltaproteobacteria bacterium]